jgi:hypothetical protein
MLLHTDKRSFSVFQTLHSYKDVNVYLANELLDDKQQANNANSRQYLINEIHSHDVIQLVIKDMLALQKESTFTEFIDVFTLDSKLYVVFSYNKPYLLNTYINRHKLSFANRVSLLQAYLFRLSTYMYLPMPILMSLIHEDNINVTPDEDIYFHFAFHPANLQPALTKQILFAEIALIIGKMFSDELTTHKGKQLRLIMQKCERNVYSSIPEIVKDVKQLDSRPFADKAKSWFTDKMSLLHKVKNFAFIGLIAVVVFVLYTRFISPSSIQPVDIPQSIQQVGELQIGEPTSSQGDESEHIPLDPAEPVIIQIDVN